MSDRKLHESISTGPGGHGETEECVMEAYRDLAAPQPSAAMDERVLASARHNVPAHGRKSTAVRNYWIMPLGLAASALLAVSLVLDTVQEAQGPAVPEQGLVEGIPGRSDSSATPRVEAPDPGPAGAGAASIQADSPVPARSAEEAKGSAVLRPHELEKLELRKRRDNAGAMKSLESTALDAEDWLVLIRSLLERGEVDGARQELERLLAQYPDRADARQLLESLSHESP